jgi:sugar phosphate isomerase/epimerase
VQLAGGLQLTYCTNIHPGESLAEVRAAISDKVAAVKARVSPDAPFGVGLRLSARAADELAAPGALADFRRLLDAHGLYVFTINGFPYGAFSGTRVKERVYLPDWRDEARFAYTERLCELLAALLPDGVSGGSVSTVPGALRSNVDGAAVTAMAARLQRQAVALERLHTRTGKHIVLALEPEPGCFLETTDDALAFFGEHLGAGRDADVARRHLALCVDACHVAVAFEDPVAAVRRLRAAGITIGKLQLSTALAVDFSGEPEVLAALAAFADDVYLHQVTERKDGRLRRWLDLPDALAAAATDGDSGTPRQWRIHFHVPLFRGQLGRFRNTQDELARLLAAVADSGCGELEVETYTWDVLPAAYRNEDVVDAIARELDWVRAHLPGGAGAP